MAPERGVYPRPGRWGTHERERGAAIDQALEGHAAQLVRAPSRWRVRLRELEAHARRLCGSRMLAVVLAGEELRAAALWYASEQAEAIAARVAARGYQRRAPHARGARAGYVAWRTRVGDALEGHGARGRELARRWRACGAVAWVRDCGACGAEYADVEVRASCSLRACPVCARREARERVERLTAAFMRLPGYVAARQGDVERELRAREAREADVRDGHYARAAAQRERAERATSAQRADEARASAQRAEGSALAAEARRTRAAFQRHLSRSALALGPRRGEQAAAERARRRAAEAASAAEAVRAELGARRDDGGYRVQGERRAQLARAARRLDRIAAREPTVVVGWSYKLVTITAPWNPSDESEMSPSRLAERARDVLDRWAACWDAGASVGGLASASVAVECSERGHVHLHALYYGPWLRTDWWQRHAGALVDVRQIEPDAADVRNVGTIAAVRNAVREATKYALKAPSTLSAEWMSGEARSVAHPKLVAAWLVGTDGAQLRRLYGAVRDALAAEPEGEGEPREPRCRCCGADLATHSAAVDGATQRPVSLARVARALGRAWARALQIEREKHVL